MGKDTHWKRSQSCMNKMRKVACCSLVVSAVADRAGLVILSQALDQLLPIRCYNTLRQIGSGIIRVEEAEHTLFIEERVKGYWIKIQYQPVEEEEKKAKREAVAQVIVQSLRRQKE